MKTKKLKEKAQEFFIKDGWLTRLLVPMLFGVVVFFGIKFFHGWNKPFWALAAWYWLFLCFLSYRKKTKKAVVKDSCLFKRINRDISLAMLVVSTTGAVFNWGIIGVPTVIVSFIIYLSASSGMDFKKNTDDEYRTSYIKL